MALTVAQYRASQPIARLNLVKASAVSQIGRFVDSWAFTPFAGAPPTTPAVPTAATVGAMPESPSGVATWLKTFIGSQTGGGALILYDRLSHQGGLSGIVTGTVTTNLPTAALTRFTSGVGVMAAVEIYATIGSTQTTLSMSYTNSAGVAGRTSPPLAVGGTGDRTSGGFTPIPLQVGDVGVRSVESVTLTGTTGSAGNYGITLWKPLGIVSSTTLSRTQRFDNLRDMGAWFESIPADACLCTLQASTSGATRGRAAEFHLIRQA